MRVHTEPQDVGLYPTDALASSEEEKRPELGGPSVLLLQAQRGPGVWAAAEKQPGGAPQLIPHLFCSLPSGTGACLRSYSPAGREETLRQHACRSLLEQAWEEGRSSVHIWLRKGGKFWIGETLPST